jgi:hypothetical protein
MAAILSPAFMILKVSILLLLLIDMTLGSFYDSTSSSSFLHYAAKTVWPRLQYSAIIKQRQHRLALIEFAMQNNILIRTGHWQWEN